MNGYTAAFKAYAENSVLSAPPGRLVVMLYDGAGRFLARAAAAAREGDAAATGVALQRTHAILDELLATLDLEQGPVAEHLQSIYLFCNRTLLEAQLALDPAPIEQVAALLAELREAWAQIADGAATAGTAPAP